MAGPVQHGLEEGCLAYVGLWYNISPPHTDVGGRRGNKKPSELEFRRRSSLKLFSCKIVSSEEDVRGRCRLWRDTASSQPVKAQTDKGLLRRAAASIRRAR